MNELTKQLIMSALVKCTYHIHWNENEFSDALDEILASRPTCGKEQRKFLDEIEKLEYDETFETPVLHKKELITQPIIFGCEFKKIDLQKVIKGE